jgi:LCP family protein required for cell wall assembly
LAIIRYAVFHPIRVTIVLLAGTLLGLGAFYAYQVQVALGAVAVEDFSPETAREAIDVEPVPERNIVFVEPNDYVQEAVPLDLVSQQRELAAAFDLNGYFDPYELNPHAFGEPIDDEVFESYLLVGTDASGFLADTIILALQPSSGGNPIMVSLPRDLYLWNICKNNFTRLNAGLGGCKGSASGMEMLAIMVEDYTGIPIDHVAKVSFSGFASVVNAIGGTTICVDYPTRDIKAQLDIPAGCQWANGATTLAWVRSRHTEQLRGEEWVQVAGSDYARQKRQQDVLFQLAGRAANFSSPASLSSKVSAISSAIRLDSSWSLGSAVSVAWKYRGISKNSVSRFSISAEGYRTPHGAAVLLPTESFVSSLETVTSLD